MRYIYSHFGVAPVNYSDSDIHRICINLLVPSAQKINIENPGNQVNYWGGGGGG